MEQPELPEMPAPAEPDPDAPLTLGQTVHWSETRMYRRSMSIQNREGVIVAIDMQRQSVTLRPTYTRGGWRKTIAFDRLHEAGARDAIDAWLRRAGVRH